MIIQGEEGRKKSCFNLVLHSQLFGWHSRNISCQTEEENVVNDLLFCFKFLAAVA